MGIMQHSEFGCGVKSARVSTYTIAFSSVSDSEQFFSLYLIFTFTKWTLIVVPSHEGFSEGLNEIMQVEDLRLCLAHTQ